MTSAAQIGIQVPSIESLFKPTHATSVTNSDSNNVNFGRDGLVQPSQDPSPIRTQWHVATKDAWTPRGSAGGR